MAYEKITGDLKVTGEVFGGASEQPLSARMTSITWSALKQLRDNGQLVPGMQYRITDYTCTTTQADTASAGHVFDIIVTADSTNKLNEVAHACLHSGDTYFANNKLEAWQLWYCIDNDTTRFIWADATNGKGVIYRMIDEFNNDVPYDFKNILFSKHAAFSVKSAYGPTYYYEFERNASLDVTGYYGWSAKGSTSWGVLSTYYTSTLNITAETILYSDTSGTATSSHPEKISTVSYDNQYTFSFARSAADVVTDASLSAGTTKCFNNFIGEYRVNGVLQLNWTLFYLSSYTTFQAYDNHIAEGNHDNSFLGTNFYSNTIGPNFYDNIINTDFRNNNIGPNFYSNNIGYNFSNNNIGSDFSNNNIGSSFTANTISSGFYSNSIGYGFHDNNIGSSFSSNNIGSSFYNNRIDSNFGSNNIGSYFDYNTIGSYFSNNNIGTSFYGNTIGSYCDCSTFGSAFYYNTIGSSASENVYVRYCKFDDGIEYISLTSADTSATASNFLKNVHVHAGIRGSSTTNRLTISVPDRNLDYSTDFYASNSQDIIL